MPLAQPGADEIENDQDVGPEDNELGQSRVPHDRCNLEGQQARESEDDDPLGPRLTAIEQKTLQRAGGAVEPGEYGSAEHESVRQVILDPMTGAAKHRASLGQLPSQHLEGPVGRSWCYSQPERDPKHQRGLAELVGNDEFEPKTLPLGRAFSIWLHRGWVWLCPGHDRPADAVDARTYTISMTTPVTIYHNPACSTSRNTLRMIRDAGIEPTVIEYLETPPDRAMLADLLRRMGMRPRQLLREKESVYAELGLAADHWTDAQLIDHMLAHPILMQRPIVVTASGVKLCRPAETVREILPAV